MMVSLFDFVRGRDHQNESLSLQCGEQRQLTSIFIFIFFFCVCIFFFKSGISSVRDYVTKIHAFVQRCMEKYEQFPNFSLYRNVLTRSSFIFVSARTRCENRYFLPSRIRYSFTPSLRTSQYLQMTSESHLRLIGPMIICKLTRDSGEPSLSDSTRLKTTRTRCMRPPLTF
jgi:hypothetical protein